MDQDLRKRIQPNQRSFLLSQKSIKSRKVSSSGYLKVRYQYFYNPNGSMGKRDTYFNGRRFQDQIFLTRNGHFKKVIIRRHLGSAQGKYLEKYHYDSNGQLIRINTTLASALQIQESEFPLMVKQTRFKYNNRGNITSITTRRLKKHHLKIEREITPDKVHNLFAPVKEISRDLYIARSLMEYRSGRITQRVEKRGLPGQLKTITVEKWEYNDSSQKHTVQILGMEVRYETRRTRRNGSLFFWQQKTFEKGELIRSEQKKFNTNGLLRSWQGKLRQDKRLIPFTWRLKYKTLSSKKSQKPLKVLQSASQFINKTKRRYIRFGYDKYGNRILRKEYRIKSDGSRQLSRQHTWKYTPTRHYYK